MNRMIMKTRIVIPGIVILVFAVVLIMAFAMVPTAEAAPAQPRFMPNFPMLAGEQVVVMWMMVPGATSYKLYSGEKVVYTGASIQTILTAPQTSGEYSYYVTAVGADGSESPKSRAGLIKIIKIMPPTELTALVIGGSDIAIRWVRAEGASISNIYRREKREKNFRLLESTQSLAFKDQQVKKDVTYVYAIKSKSVTGKLSRFSDPVEIMVPTEKAAAVKEIWKLNPLPMIKRVSYRLPTSPMDVVSWDDGKQAVVSDGNLRYFSSVGQSPEFTTLFSSNLEEGIPSPVKGVQFSGIALDEDGTLLAVAREEVFRIDIERESVIWRIKVPPGGVGIDGEPDEEPLKYLQTVKGKKVVQAFKSKPYLVDVAVGPDGTIYASDNTNQRVVKLDPDGEFLGTLGYDPFEEIKNGPNWRVSAANYISANAEGLVFVNTPFTVVVYGPDEKKWSIVGGLGDTVGSFGMVQGTMVDDDGRLWVTDIRNGTLQVFKTEKDAEKGTEWVPVLVGTRSNKKGNPAWSKPNSLAIGPRGKFGPTLLVTDGIERHLHLFDVMWNDAG